jgi:hypothetical protein
MSSKAVSSISAIINTKDMTIQVSNMHNKNLYKQTQNHSKSRKKSKTKTSMLVKMPDKMSILSSKYGVKRGNFSSYSISQDYSFITKNLK